MTVAPSEDSSRRSDRVFVNRGSDCSRSRQCRRCRRFRNPIRLERMMRRRSGGGKGNWLVAVRLVGFIWGWIWILESYLLLSRWICVLCFFVGVDLCNLLILLRLWFEFVVVTSWCLQVSIAVNSASKEKTQVDWFDWVNLRWLIMCLYSQIVFERHLN